MQTQALARDMPGDKKTSGASGVAGKLLRLREKLVRASSRGTIFLPVIACALWALARPYQGIIGDATLYIGRALADLDPNGLGRDLLFAHDGQSQFSLYPWIVKRLVLACGTNVAALALVIASACLWIAALNFLARRFVSRQASWIIVAFLAVLPVSYGMPLHFSFSEVMAVPRPFAEASVLLALALFIDGRMSLAFAALVLATLVHPLMALAGWAVIWLALCLEDRRWAIAAGLAAAGIVLGAFLRLPLLDRLFVVMDPEMKSLATHRSALLFPTSWPIDFLGPICAQMATLFIAARLFLARRRRVLLAAMSVGLLGVAVQALCGDLLSSLLVIQVQFWRMTWLTAAIGNFALALCALELCRRDEIDRMVLAILAMSWLASDQLLPAAVLAASALILQCTKERFAWPVSRLSVRIIWICTCLFALALNISYFLRYAHFVAGMPAGNLGAYGFFWNKHYLAFAICPIVIALMLPRHRSYWLAAGRCGAALVLVAAVCVFWDNRTPMTRLIDSNIHPPALMQAIKDRPGEMLWIDGIAEAWYLTGRPQWASAEQGVASIFSRDLGLAWRDRMVFLRDEGLVERTIFASVALPSSQELPHLSESGVAHLCARSDAPAWIIAPSETGANPLPDRSMQVWHPPQPLFRLTDDGDNYHWHQIKDYLIFACAGAKPSSNQ